MATTKTSEPGSANGRTTTKAGRKPKAGDTLGLTLGELAELYLLHMEQLGKSRGTVFSYSIDLGLAVREVGEDTRIKALTPEKIGAFFESDAVTKTRTGKPKAKPTIDKTRRVLRLALVWAAETGEIPVAPLPENVVDGRKVRANKEADTNTKARHTKKPADDS